MLFPVQPERPISLSKASMAAVATPLADTDVNTIVPEPMQTLANGVKQLTWWVALASISLLGMASLMAWYILKPSVG
jgi:hypothetical protein